MARRGNHNNEIDVEEVLATAPTEQDSVIGVDLAQNEDTTIVTEVKAEKKANKKQVKVICPQLYFRPEPNKKQTIGILTQGAVLTVIEKEEKLPEGWLHVSTESAEGYVVAEYVESV